MSFSTVTRALCARLLMSAAFVMAPAVADEAKPRALDINEFEIDGIKALPQIAVEAVLEPYLGESRELGDIEKARAALENLYHDRGYQAVSVQIPQQKVRGGVVRLTVVEGRVGKLTVKNARYYDEDTIRETVPSLREGETIDFKKVTDDIVAVNQWPDRKVTPELRAGETPGTVDVDLVVEDKLPLHGRVELNNRKSPSTEPLRASANLHYDNLWQMGHSINFAYQVAPENRSQAEVYSGSYLARIPGNSWLSFLVYGLKSDSNVATLDAMNVIGRGEVIGLRAIATLPYSDGFFHTLNLGFDYKHFDENISLDDDAIAAPITYYPFVLNYMATWQSPSVLTQLDAGMTFHFRGMGSNENGFDYKRYNSSGGFIYFRGSLSQTRQLPWGFEAYGRLGGQLTGQALVSSEEYSAGGLDSVRGYRESEALGDSGYTVNLELRSPSLPSLYGGTLFSRLVNEWRFHVFADMAELFINDALTEQQSRFGLYGVGAGSRLKFLDYFNCALDVGVPLNDQTSSKEFSPRVSFRVWAEL